MNTKACKNVQEFTIDMQLMSGDGTRNIAINQADVSFNGPPTHKVHKMAKEYIGICMCVLTVLWFFVWSKLTKSAT